MDKQQDIKKQPASVAAVGRDRQQRHAVCDHTQGAGRVLSGAE
jgi:hypothetical protein